MLSVSPPAFAASQSGNHNGFEFKVDPGNPTAGATITGYTGPAGVVRIPDSVRSKDTDYTVTTIGEAAFPALTLTGVHIPGSVTTIGKSAFVDCFLSELTIPDSVISIGDGAFANNKLRQVQIGKSVTTIGVGAFRNNRGMTQVEIPDSVTTIGHSAFRDNTGLGKVNIGNSVSVIGDAAFNNNSLREVQLPGSVETIGAEAFANNSLATVTIPTSVTSIGNSAFRNFELKRVVFEGNAPAITSAGLDGSFGDKYGKTLYYYSSQNGFTAPTWKGYQTLPVPYTVNFDPQGGSAVSDHTVKHGDKANRPADPTRTSYTFTGWHTVAEATSTYEFNTPVEADLTLYAGWEKDAVVNPPKPGPENPGPENPAPENPSPEKPGTDKPGTEAPSTTLPVTGGLGAGGLAAAGILAAAAGAWVLTRRRTAQRD